MIWIRSHGGLSCVVSYAVVGGTVRKPQPNSEIVMRERPPPLSREIL